MPLYRTLPVKATGAELDGLTDDAKFLTAKAVQDGKNVPHAVPGTAGHIMQSDGTNWGSGVPVVTYLSNPYKIRAYKSTAANSPNNAAAKVTFETEDFDTNSNFATSTYTVPITGYYAINATIGVSGGATLVPYIYVNGASVATGNYFVAGYYSSVSDMRLLTAGNTVEIYVYTSAVKAFYTGSDKVWLSIYLVSTT